MGDRLLDYQKSLLLLHLLGGPKRTLKKSEANSKLTRSQKKKLDLSTQGANKLREELAQQGYLQCTAVKRSTVYELTDRGLAFLAGQEQYPTLSIPLEGKELNALLAAVRELAASWPESTPSDSNRRPVPEHLDRHIFAEFREIQQERYSQSRLVPIHEIRQRIAQKFGAAAARHEIFDDHVKRLWREGKVRLVPISDLRDATAQQLNDSIPGVNETHFYLEHARELALSD